jgi:hypothetical protein
MIYVIENNTYLREGYIVKYLADNKVFNVENISYKAITR